MSYLLLFYLLLYKKTRWTSSKCANSIIFAYDNEMKSFEYISKSFFRLQISMKT